MVSPQQHLRVTCKRLFLPFDAYISQSHVAIYSTPACSQHPHISHSYNTLPAMATPTASASPECSHLLSPNPYTTALAAVILVGILISYLPQHLKIISNRSSAGLSPWWVLLGGLSSIAALGNILVLPRSRQDMRCCAEISGGECAASLLGVAQLGLQWGCFMFM